VATEPVLITTSRPSRAAHVHSPFTVATYARVADYWALTKPDVNFLIVVATLTGFYLASPGPLHNVPLLLLVHTLLGTLLVASGTGTLNQYAELHFDAQMRRTARRPLAAGRLKPSVALSFGVALSAVGGVYLAVAVSPLASLLAVLTLLSYLFMYTPLKRKTPLCTLVGAFPGAMPTLIGWAAASGKLTLEASILYAILFLWQFPHFMAIAWMYREDYDRAGYRVLPAVRLRGGFISWMTVLPILALIVVSLVRAVMGHHSFVYSVGVVMLGSIFLYYGIQLALRKSNSGARRLLYVSIFYLPLVFVAMMIDKG
jgi:protoheme IX farnesyltransferase